MSGTSPKRSQANMAPVRAKPVCTSSAISTMPYLSQVARSPAKNSGRRNYEAAFAEDRLDDDGGDGLLRNVAAKELVEGLRSAVGLATGIRLAVRAAIAVGVRDAIDVAGEGLESGLVGMGLAGQRHAEQGAAMEGVFETHDRRTLGVGARDLHRVLDGLGAGVQEKRLLGEIAGREPVHGFGQRDVVLVRRDLRAGVQEAINLLVNCGGHRGIAMSHIEAPDASGEIDEGVAIDVFQQRAFRPGDIDRRGVREAARNGLLAPLV